MKFQKISSEQIESKRKGTRSLFVVTERPQQRSRLPSLRNLQPRTTITKQSLPKISRKVQIHSNKMTNNSAHLLLPPANSISTSLHKSSNTDKSPNSKPLERGIYRNAKFSLGKIRLQTPPLLAQYNIRRQSQLSKPKKNQSHLRVSGKSDSIQMDLLMEQRGVVHMVRRISESYQLLKEYGYSEGQIYKLAQHYCRENIDMEKIFFHRIEQPIHADCESEYIRGPLRWERHEILRLVRETARLKNFEGVKELVYRVGELAQNLEEGILKKTDSKVNELCSSIKDRQFMILEKKKQIGQTISKEVIGQVQSPRMIKARYSDFRQDVKDIQRKYGACQKITQVNRKLFQILNSFAGQKTLHVKSQSLANSFQMMYPHTCF